MNEPRTACPRPASHLESTEAIRAMARSNGPDRLPDNAHPPVPGLRATWFYPWGQFELARLHQLVREGFAANRFVHYSRNYGDISPVAVFRCTVPPRAGRITLRATGAVSARCQGTVLECSHTVEGTVVIDLPAEGGELILEICAEEGVPAAFTVLEEPTASGAVHWECAVGVSDWTGASTKSGMASQAPHLSTEPIITIAVSLIDGVFQTDAPVLGKPVIECAGTPRITTGESREEALAAEVDHEVRHDLVQLSDGRWTSQHALGLRYLVVHDVEPRQVTVEAYVHPVKDRGAFTCSDDQLNRIWSTSAYTLRLCMHGLMLDGIKRDRMPWIGDQALNTLSNAYAFGDGDIIRDSLLALGQPRHGYVNGISDYSLWWVVNRGFYARYFGAAVEPGPEAAHVHEFLERLAVFAGVDGVFRPTDQPDLFERVFIDWGVEVAGDRDSTALQMLWFWALKQAASLLGQAGHPGATRWGDLAVAVGDTLRRRAWDDGEQAWREYLDEPSTISVYPNFLAVLCGISEDAPDGVRHVLRSTPHVGTPFMTSFALRALGMAGETQSAVARIKALWGQMLDAGARSFWEEFGDASGDALSMYGRRFGKSLCHAWAAGPAALLPEMVLGLCPLSDGWTRFSVDPSLGELEWASAVVPTPQGPITVVAATDQVIVDVPAGSTLVSGESHYLGPQQVSLPVALR